MTAYKFLCMGRLLPFLQPNLSPYSLELLGFKTLDILPVSQSSHATSSLMVFVQVFLFAWSSLLSPNLLSLVMAALLSDLRALPLPHRDLTASCMSLS